MKNSQLREYLSKFVGQYFKAANGTFMFITQAHKLYRLDRIRFDGPSFRINEKHKTLWIKLQDIYTTDFYNPKITIIDRSEFLQGLKAAIAYKDQLVDFLKNPTVADCPAPVTVKELADYYEKHPRLIKTHVPRHKYRPDRKPLR